MTELVSFVPWPLDPTVPDPNGPLDTDSWWGRYWSNLTASSLSPLACDVIDTDSSYIVERGVLGAGRPSDGSWPASRVRKGLVMGSVQSGKTASMLAVAAKSLDAGVDAVVILAGTQVGLWRQTYRRVTNQLDLAGPSADNHRIILPSHAQGRSGTVAPPGALYGLAPARARRAVEKSRPVLAISLKNVHHLRALGQTISPVLIAEATKQGKDFHVLVLDDEADDGSIDEVGLGAADEDFRQLPNTIVDLWESRPRQGTTKSPNLFVTYVGYTATPQANFLQQAQNELAPTDFIVSLRTPLDRGELTPRSPTFKEPLGIASYYVGGEFFYRRLASPGLTVSLPEKQADAIPAAVRAFLVAGAVRLWRRPASTLLPRQAMRTTWTDEESARRECPPVHSMLFHPSAQISDHFEAAATVLAWAGSIGQDDAAQRLAQGERNLPVAELIADVEANEADWTAWIDSYDQSNREIRTVFSGEMAPGPTVVDWPDIRRFLVEEVIPTTQLSVVNSDPLADDRPQFEPVFRDGNWVAPPNLSTIFIAGNVMSRGLTLEGLTTTLFLRTSDDPYADTQSQMQRWFGYRGPFIDLVRLFADEQQIKLFGAYHDADEAVRSQVIAQMSTDGPAPTPTVLQTHDFKATGKIANLRSVPLWPGPTPFLRLINAGQAADRNTTLLAELFDRSAHSEVRVAGSTRGKMLDQPLSLPQAAELLEGLRFDHYAPSPHGWQAARWRSAEQHLRASGGRLQGPLYRSPAPLGTSVHLDQERVACPYSFAAYLRLWSECLEVRSAFFASTEDGRSWAMADLNDKRSRQPRFNVGIRYGGEPVEALLPGGSINVRPMSRSIEEGELVAAWGSRNRDSDWAGDEWFDIYAANGAPTDHELRSGCRSVGRPGLILFHVVRQPGAPFLTTTVGLAVPMGGPDQIAARAKA